MEAELGSCGVRRNYFGQVDLYSVAVARWRRKLGAFRREPDGYPVADALRAILRAAQEDTAFYPERFHRAGVQWSDLCTTGDLRHFPLTSRADVQGRFEDLLAFSLTLRDREEGIVWQTSGTTGEPVRFFVNGESNKFPLALYRFLMRGEPRPFSSVVLLCSLPKSAIYETRLPLFGGAEFRKLHWSEPGAKETLERLDPEVITGDPDSLAPLRGMRVRPRLVLSSAFELPEDLATEIGIVDCYSIAETGPIAVRCAPGRGFHVLGAACHVEEVDGEIVVTNFRNPLFPLVRYRTGDAGEVSRERCACGYSGPTIARLTGRTTPRFRGGFDPSRLEPILSRLPVRQFQLREEGEALRLRYFGDPIDDAPELRAAVARHLGRPLELERSGSPLWRPGEKPRPYFSTT